MLNCPYCLFHACQIKGHFIHTNIVCPLFFSVFVFVCEVCGHLYVADVILLHLCLHRGRHLLSLHSFSPVFIFFSLHHHLFSSSSLIFSSAASYNRGSLVRPTSELLHI